MKIKLAKQNGANKAKWHTTVMKAILNVLTWKKRRPANEEFLLCRDDSLETLTIAVCVQFVFNRANETARLRESDNVGGFEAKLALFLQLFSTVWHTIEYNTVAINVGTTKSAKTKNQTDATSASELSTKDVHISYGWSNKPTVPNMNRFGPEKTQAMVQATKANQWHADFFHLYSTSGLQTAKYRSIVNAKSR